jgi:hypothetical protein
MTGTEGRGMTTDVVTTLTSDLGSLAVLRPVISPLELHGYLTGIG